MSACMPQFSQMIAKIQENIGSKFESHPDYLFQDQVYPMMLSFFSEVNKKTIIGTKAKAVTRSWEFCLIENTPCIGEADLDGYLKLCQDFCAQMVERDDPCHSFTYVSLILLTEEFDLSLRKKLKNFHEEIDYRFTNGYGWSSLRIAVVDGKSQNIYTNHYGADLKKRLTSLF